MPGITLNNSLVSYYGNPAGYTEKNVAVLDSIFQNEELSAWLQSRSLTPQWTDGVMERLLVGEQIGDWGEAAPLKNVRIWQLNPDSDIRMKFIGLEETEKQFGQPNLVHYCIAYDGQLGTNDLEAIYERCNINHPSGYDGHSLSISDVVELYNGEGSKYYYCDHFAFKQIDIEPAVPTMDMKEELWNNKMNNCL